MRIDDLLADAEVIRLSDHPQTRVDPSRHLLSHLIAPARNPWSFGEARHHEVLRRAHIDGWVANPTLWLAGRLGPRLS